MQAWRGSDCAAMGDTTSARQASVDTTAERAEYDEARVQALNAYNVCLQQMRQASCENPVFLAAFPKQRPLSGLAGRASLAAVARSRVVRSQASLADALTHVPTGASPDAALRALQHTTPPDTPKVPQFTSSHHVYPSPAPINSRRQRVINQRHFNVSSLCSPHYRQEIAHSQGLLCNEPLLRSTKPYWTMDVLRIDSKPVHLSGGSWRPTSARRFKCHAHVEKNEATVENSKYHCRETLHTPAPLVKRLPTIVLPQSH